MLKTLAVLCLLSIAAPESFSQNFGLRAGINSGSLNSEFEGGDISTDGKVGFMVSVLTELGLNDDFAIQPELQFIQKGGKTTLDFFGSELKSTLTVNYLEVPVNAKYKFVNNEKVKVFALAGPSFGFALSGESEDCDGADCVTTDIDFDADGFKRFEVGFTIGAGAQFGNFFFDLRFVPGLTNLQDDEDDGIKTTNRGLQAGVGYLFGS